MNKVQLQKYDPTSVAPFIPDEPPKFEPIESVIFDCYHCGRSTKVPIKPEHYGWKAEAELYKKCYEEIWREVNQMMMDLDAMGQIANPIRTYVKNEWKLLREKIEECRRNL